MVACKSVNWNWPGETSVALPSTIQLLRVNATFVAARTVKPKPGVLVKLNWQAPPGSLTVLVRMIGPGAAAAAAAPISNRLD